MDGLLVILGAGASYDCVSPRELPGMILEYRPPLAAQLFDTRQVFGKNILNFSAIQPIVPQLRQSGAHVERELERLESETVKDVRRRHQLLAVRFYLQKIILECTETWFGHAFGVTNYGALVDQVEHWRRTGSDRVVTYVTFNYDTLLEKSAIVTLRHVYEQLGSYVENPSHTWIIKPHGSIDWSRAVRLTSGRGPFTEQQLIDQADGLDLLPEYYKTMSLFDDRVGSLVPAIAIPFETKSSFECPEDHLKKLAERIRRTTKILVIGWRGAEAHFLKMLAEGLVNSKPAILIVSDTEDSAKGTMLNLKRGNVPDQGGYDLYYHGGFSGLIINNRLDSFLGSADHAG